ncbi:hypothetical protein C0081_04550 [Cohaesibacter celericrescens]|uniref:Uncharacterized protein n=1 Tax=Cohaesibacter celericrescens TaxID=2067669 RepID=A0A2N5XV52_9HYPH|nr:hypothetical protein C0081_04550 [Cohaesibacter celericrescens]
MIKVPCKFQINGKSKNSQQFSKNERGNQAFVRQFERWVRDFGLIIQADDEPIDGDRARWVG